MNVGQPINIDVLKDLEDRKFREIYLSSSLGHAISQQIKELRTSREMTQEQLAAGISISVNKLKELENPDVASTIRVELLLKIAKFFDVALTIQFVDWATYLAWIKSFEIYIPPKKFNVEDLTVS